MEVILILGHQYQEKEQRSLLLPPSETRDDLAEVLFSALCLLKKSGSDVDQKCR